MRLTLDSNQFIRSLMRPPELATFIMAWQAKRFTIVTSSELLHEYHLVLNYPKIRELIYPELQRIYLTQLSDYMELVDLPEIPQICRDPDDDKVIATAIYGMVDYLVTDDEDLKTGSVIQILQATGIKLATIDDILVLVDENKTQTPED